MRAWSLKAGDSRFAGRMVPGIACVAGESEVKQPQAIGALLARNRERLRARSSEAATAARSA